MAALSVDRRILIFLMINITKLEEDLLPRLKKVKYRVTLGHAIYNSGDIIDAYVLMYNHHEALLLHPLESRTSRGVPWVDMAREKTDGIYENHRCDYINFRGDDAPVITALIEALTDPG